MATEPGLLPHRPAVDAPDPETRVLTLGSDEMTTVCGVLSSETASRILSNLQDQPMTASDIADQVDTSLQNVNYHVTRLRDADLVRVVDTWYSSRGAEMKVYAPVHEQFVVRPHADGDAADGTARSDGSTPDGVGIDPLSTESGP